jgi:hypothetical protein
MKGDMGIGVISDYEDQPLSIGSHLGTCAIVTLDVIDLVEAIGIPHEKLCTVCWSGRDQSGPFPGVNATG